MEQLAWSVQHMTARFDQSSIAEACSDLPPTGRRRSFFGLLLQSYSALHLVREAL
jgi:hypothetical protein